MLEKTPENLTYRILEENVENIGASVVEKVGMVVTFTVDDIDRDLVALRKKREELEGQMKIESARMVNIDRTNPEIGQMSEEMRQVVYIYERAYAFCKVGGEKIAEIVAQEKEYRDEVTNIIMQTGIKIPMPTVEEKPKDETNGNEQGGN